MKRKPPTGKSLAVAAFVTSTAVVMTHGASAMFQSGRWLLGVTLDVSAVFLFLCLSASVACDLDATDEERK